MKKVVRKNFSCSELAIVVAVAGLVLFAILSVARANTAQAKAVSCKEKLHNIGRAALLYAENNAGFVPCQDRPDKPGHVEGFGNHQGKYSWTERLIGGGYFGNAKPTVRYEQFLPEERMKYFICPKDKDAYKKSKFHISYNILSINDVAAVERKRYGDEQYSRVLVTRDRPENSVVYDIFTYRGSVYKKSTHGENANILRLGGEVDTVDVKPAATASSVWNWIGEFVDEIEL